MFTGIIEALGKVAAIESRGQDLRMEFEATGLDLSQTLLGDSIAVNGVCLTVISLSSDRFSADVSLASIRHSSLAQLQPGSRVNLERALTLSKPLGGHLVSGHVDGVAVVTRAFDEGRARRFWLSAPEHLARYIAARGSITIDGVSLTVNEVDGASFSLNLVPHSLAKTTLSQLKVGQQVNIEVDLLARYLERLLSAGQNPATRSGGISLDFLRQHGFYQE